MLFRSAKPSEPSPPAEPAPRDPSPFKGKTALSLEVQRAPSTPFGVAPPKAKRAKLAESAAFELPPELRAKMMAAMSKSALPAEPARPQPPAAPAPPAPTGPPPPPPVLTLQQHASLTVELELAPKNAAAIHARYGLTAGMKKAVDDHYHAELSRSPELRRAWRAARDAYRDWLTKNR